MSALTPISVGFLVLKTRVQLRSQQTTLSVASGGPVSRMNPQVFI